MSLRLPALQIVAAAVILSLLVIYGSASVQVNAQQGLTPGSVIGLSGTPHLWIVDEEGRVHWAGDTRALEGHIVLWEQRRDVGTDELRRFPIGDPWLSTGLLKDGDPIYLVKWESTSPQPELFHIQSLADVELFGINGTNYGLFVLDLQSWSERFKLDPKTLTRSTLPAATQPAGASPTGGTAATPGPTAVPAPRLSSDGCECTTGSRPKYTSRSWPTCTRLLAAGKSPLLSRLSRSSHVVGVLRSGASSLFTALLTALGDSVPFAPGTPSAPSARWARR